MTNNHKIISTYLAYNKMQGRSGVKIAAEENINRRNFSYLTTIKSLVTEDEFKYICDTLKCGNYVTLSTGERTRSIEGLLNALKVDGVTIVQNTSTPMVLYVLKAGPFIKIGVAKSITNRLKSIQTGNPYTVEVYRVFILDSEIVARTAESILHAKYVEYKTTGEWFAIPDEALIDIDHCVSSYNVK